MAHELWSMGSVAAALGLSFSTACGILPVQGLNQCPLHWQVDSYPKDHQGSPALFLYSANLMSCLYIIN